MTDRSRDGEFIGFSFLKNDPEVADDNDAKDMIELSFIVTHEWLDEHHLRLGETYDLLKADQ